MNSKTVFLQTYGCQMNERDSEEVLGMLMAQGYDVAQRPQEADVILLNTCSVRAHAEDRAYGKMRELSALKEEKPGMVLGILGCMAKLHQEAIFKQLPFVDLIAGPAELYDLPYLLAEIQEKRQAVVHDPSSIVKDRKAMDKVVAVGRQFRPLERKPVSDYHRPGVRAFVTIMEGCDKACTYCIVPKTRGQEISRPVGEIIDEIRRLVAAGYRDITLLGQNVNSYGKRFPDGSGYKGSLGRLRLLEHDPDALLDFPQLLRLIDASLHSSPAGGEEGPQGLPLRQQPPCSNSSPSGLATARGGSGFAASAAPRELVSGQMREPVRVRFTTSHPFDATERLFAAMRDCDSVCESLHLPVQSGSNRILRAMRRGYTVEAYLKKLELLRRDVPEVSLSTDIIIGFPGETDDDFEATVRLLREVRYDNAYIFKYSPRPGTDAAAREDDVPHAVKEERNHVLLALQRQIDHERYQAMQGQVVEILVEERGKGAGQWFGRTRGNDGVILEDAGDLRGQVVPVRITRGVPYTLFGDISREPCLKSSASWVQLPSENPRSLSR